MEAVDYVDRDTLEPLVMDSISEDARVYSDDASVYDNIPNHESVKHSIGEYVRDDVDTNSIESQFALLKRGIYGTYHHISPKHTHRYAAEFAGRHNARPFDTIEQIRMLVRGMDKKRLKYADLIS